ncbi:ribonuclease T2 [Rhypophila decipiens]
MSSPLPVPSKAALRALRGLVLGTSCTLALITEDRRRRIDHALKILENGERVKAARSYRAGGGEQLFALEHGEPSLDPTCFRLHGPVPRLPVDGSPELLQDRRVRARKRRDDIAAAPEEDIVGPEQSPGNVVLAGESNRQPAAGAEQRGENVARAGSNRKRTAKSIAWVAKFPHQPKPAAAPCPTIRKYAFPSNGRIGAMINEACASESLGEITGAVQHVFSAYKAGVAPGVEDKEWVTACALLCRACQKVGRLGDATRLLTQVLQNKVDEETYFAFDPLSLITSLLKQVLSLEDPETCREIMDTCVALFLPRFAQQTQRKSEQLFELGKALMENELKLDRLQHMFDLYLRCVHVAAEEQCDLSGFTEWVIDNMHQRGGYKTAVRLFYSRYVNMSPGAASMDKFCGVVVNCVEAAHNYMPEKVLRAMIKLSESSGKKLRVDWVMKLLTSHWKREKSLEEVEGLFKELAAVGFDKLMFNPHAICRVMVEIALEAGDTAKVDHYIVQGTSLDPNFANHPSLMGALALFDAKIGNWEAVKQCFTKMDHIISHLPATRRLAIKRANNKARSNAFVPILKIYAEEHSIAETEEFLKLYIDRLGVSLSPFMVPLVAKHYAALRDFPALSKWLLYCASAIPQVTPEFGNAILASCRGANMPFFRLRSLFHKLKEINPNAVDRISERIMLNSAISASTGGRIASRRIRLLGIDSSSRATAAYFARKRRCASEQEVRLSMKSLLTRGRPGEALCVYKRALHLGMPENVRSLRLAVLAQLQYAKFGRSNDVCFKRAWDLVAAAQGRGCEVDLAANLLLGKQLRVLLPNRFREQQGATARHGEEVFEFIKDALSKCEQRGIVIDDRMLNQAGLTCLGQQLARGALLFAELAAERVVLGPCYNSMNFRVFMLAYADLFDVEGLRESVERASGSSYWEQWGCRETLRLARVRMMLSRRAGNVANERRLFADGIVKEARERVVHARGDLRERREEFEGFALEIMREAAGAAAVDTSTAKRELVGGDDLPGLGGTEQDEQQDWLLEALDGSGKLAEAAPGKDESAGAGAGENLHPSPSPVIVSPARVGPVKKVYYDPSVPPSVSATPLVHESIPKGALLKESILKKEG